MIILKSFLAEWREMIVKPLGPNISSINAAVLTRTKIGGRILTLIQALVQTTTAETPITTTVARIVTMLEEDMTPDQVIITTRITESYPNHAVTLHINRYQKTRKNYAFYCQVS